MNKTIGLFLIVSLLLFGCTSQQSAPAADTDVIVEEAPIGAGDAAVGTGASGIPEVSEEEQEAAEVEEALQNAGGAAQSEGEVAAVESLPGEFNEVRLTARQWEFEPATANVQLGDKVKLIITSTDVTHGFSLPDFNVNAQLEPGQTTELVFIADRPGTFDFFCSVFCGSGHSGMRGRLVVTE